MADVDDTPDTAVGNPNSLELGGHADQDETSSNTEPPQHGGVENIPADVRDQIVATLYGQCMGDAIGLLSEFMDKEEATAVTVDN